MVKPNISPTYEFRSLRHVTGHRQTTNGEEYETGYVYNLSGALIEQTYPSGRVVKNVLDNNGDLSMVQSRKSENHGYWNYANSFTYNAAGAVTSMQLGNGRWESTQFNSRLQPTQIALGVTPSATNLLKLDYSYGTTANSGNVISQTITVPTVGVNPGFTAIQNYTYDSLNRLESAEETISSVQTWKQAFTFDRYGNRNFDEAETTTLPKNCGTSPNFTVCAADKKVFNPDLNPANNRMASGQDYTYDATGNVIEDAEGRTFTYDAENKQIEVENSLSQTVGQYFFDGDGKRVKKIVPSTGEVTIFVYDAGAKLIGEYSTVVEVATPKVQYLTNDHLGSPRINTDQDGLITSRTDYMPYGEEIIGLGNRTSNESYVADDVRQGFTGYERDGETGLDFAQSRNYAKDLGRFSSADDVINDSNLMRAQSWNKYAYVQNSPLTAIDPDGRKGTVIVTVDEQTKKVNVTFKTSIGFWGQKGKINTADALAAVKKNVGKQLQKWATDNLKIDGGYSMSVNVDVTIKTFQNAKSYDDVLKQDSSIENVIRLVDGPTQENPSSGCGSNSNSCMHGDYEGGSRATINNSDGTKPDTGTWRYSNASGSIEPAHEFIHIMGKGHPNWAGDSGFSAQNTTATHASALDYKHAFGEIVTKAIEKARFNYTQQRWRAPINSGKATLTERRRIASN